MKKKPVRSALPKRVDAIIIGGGLIGCSTAWYLAKQGLDVLVFEKCHTVGYEQSSRNWGFVRQLGRDPKELPLMMLANGIWQGLEKDLGADLGWQQGGVLGMTDDSSIIPDFEQWCDVARSFDLECSLKTGEQVAELIPGMARQWAGGIFVPGDGNADADITTAAFARAVTNRGGRIETDCAVLDIELQGGVAGGSVCGVVSEHGTVSAPVVIVAAGAWASRVLSWLDLDMPQMRIRGSVARSMPVAPITPVAAWTPSIGFVQRKDGCFNIGGLDITDHDVSLESLHYARYFFKDLIKHHHKIRLQFGHPFLNDLIGRLPGSRAMGDPLRRARIGNAMPNSRRILKCFEDFHDLFPATNETALKKAWAGHIDVTPDMLPVIDGQAGPRGLLVAAGFSGHGFGIGPAAGQMIAQLVHGENPAVDLAAFSLARFASGNWQSAYNLI